ELAVKHAEDLIASGMNGRNIAIITPYNGQVRVLVRMQDRIRYVEIGSIDGFQGSEKEAVILSLVRSNPRKSVGFLDDYRRINVAITRARRHLCVIADSRTISGGGKFLNALLVHLKTNGHVIRSVISGVKGGILVKDGKRTSCDLGVVTSSGAYVAKDCLDYTKTGNIDNSTTYEAYLDDGLDGKPIKYTITNFFKVTNNSQTLSNNYVYLRYNNYNSTLWKNMVSPTLGYAWDAVVYVRRSLRDMGQMVWDDPEFIGLGTDYDGS
ncbi:hypothetical protein LPJ62_006684, partial [Coemansia sp. RSA 2167]